MRLRADEGVAEGLERVAGRPCGDPDVGAVVAVELHVGAIGADALDDRVAREVGRADDGRRPADHRAWLVGLVGVAGADRGDVGARRERALVEGDRGRRERARDHVRGLAEVGRAVLDLDRVDLRVVGLGGRVVPGAAAADGPADHGRVVDLRPAAGRLDRAELRRRRDPVRDLLEVTVGLARVDRTAAEVGECARADVVVVALVGGDLGAGDDQLARVVGLVAADLTPVDVVVVVDQADEVEPGATRRQRREREVERRRHQRVAGLLLAVHVDVAGVPTGAGRRRSVVVRDARVRMVGPAGRRCSSRRGGASRRRPGRSAGRRSRRGRARPPRRRPGSGRPGRRGSCIRARRPCGCRRWRRRPPAASSRSRRSPGP